MVRDMMSKRSCFGLMCCGVTRVGALARLRCDRDDADYIPCWVCMLPGTRTVLRTKCTFSKSPAVFVSMQGTIYPDPCLPEPSRHVQTGVINARHPVNHLSPSLAFRRARHEHRIVFPYGDPDVRRPQPATTRL